MRGSEGRDVPPEAATPAIGPALARAIATITELGRKLDLSVSSSLAAARQLSLRLEDKSGETLTLLIEPLREQGNYYRKSDRLGFWYWREETSSGTVPAWTNPLLESVARVVLSPQHDAVADELATQARDAERPQTFVAQEPVAMTPPAAPAARRPASYSIARGYVGWLPASPRHVLMKLLKPLYDRYVLAILARYTPVEARAAESVLDAMCGRNLANLASIRRYFAGARIVAATDIDIDERRKAPRGTSVFRADLLEPLPAGQRYQLITVFKPPTGALGQRIETVLTHLVNALQPGGYLFLVLGALDQVDHIAEALERLGLSIETSERNALSSVLEIEHVWILIGRAPGGG